MRFHFLLIALLLVFQSTYAQDNKEIKNANVTVAAATVTFDPVYFVLGTLGDYLGRFHYVDRVKQVDRYYLYEKPLVDYLSGYIKSNLQVDVAVTDRPNHRDLFSDELSKTLNGFYGERDELIGSKFETNRQIASFLAGVYYRYGEKLDTSVYKIQLANSPKHQSCYAFLKQIGCENIFYQQVRNIPAQFILYFEPTDELKKYLDIIEPERILLKKSLDSQMVAVMKGHQTKEVMERNFQRSKDKEVEKIKNVFRR